MKTNLFDRIDVKPENTHLPDGNADAPCSECAAYDDLIDRCGGIDLQLLGIGSNGHIGFNEPADSFTDGTFVTELAPSTIDANKRFFASADDVPRRAVTMGIGRIMQAKRVVLIATGKSKAQAVLGMLKGPVSPSCPASILQNHPDAVALLDREAASLL